MKISIALLSCLLSITATAQNKIRSVTLSDTVLSAAVDRPGDFYLVTKSGQIQRFDKDGKLIVLYKTEAAPTLFDPRDGARLFAYYRHDQRYEYLSPSFQVSASYKIDPSFAIHPWLMCPSGDHKLWILDKADNSLKKINVRESEVELEVMVDSAVIQNTEMFTAMREYQSFVFLLDPSKGIAIFNNLGKYLRTIEVPGVQSFNFLGEELYYLRGQKVELFNLFSAETRQLDLPSHPSHVLLTDERMILVTPLRIDIFSFRP
jgi:hypothetical protein